MQTTTSQRYDVGGILFPQPFKVRRLGHFGLNVEDTQATLAYYCDLLGFRLSDPMDLAAHLPNGAELKKIGDTHLYFTRHGTDHHSFVFGDRNVAKTRGEKLPDDVTVNQLTWQVGSLGEISGGIDYFKSLGIPIQRVGRDMPGSNWHVYPYDPEGHRNELYYGMEQIGWTGTSKPKMAYDRGFRERPSLPQVPEYMEVERMREAGVDLSSGHHDPEKEAATYDVDGILLARPFKVVRHGPVGLFCKDLDGMERFYTQIMGFSKTTEIDYHGHRCVFLRCNTEHHSLALYPIALRKELGMNEKTTVMRFGVQVGSYRQLQNALKYLQERGCSFIDVPPELTPGIDYSAHVLDPSGHAVQIYFSMEQVGWDGVARTRGPHEGYPSHQWQQWPKTIEAKSDTYMGEILLGPWG